MMKTRYTLVLLIVCVLLFACACAGSAGTAADSSAETNAGTDANITDSLSADAAVSTQRPEDAYRLEKLNEVSDMVLAREIVPEDYFRYLDEEMVQAVASYNLETGLLREQYAADAAGIANALFYEHKESPGDYDQPWLYYEWIARISRYALYENVADLCRGDPYLSYPLGKEAGGSFGMWAAQLEDRVKREQQAYFDQVDALLDMLDAARSAG